MPALLLCSLAVPKLDRNTDQRTVLGPRAVVVLHVRLAEQFVQHEPGVRGPLADTAVGDGVLAEVEAGLVAVERAEVVVGLERAILLGSLRPGHILRGRHVTATLRGFLRQVRRREQT